MATEKAPTKAEFLEALKKKGINNLEDLLDAIMPETGGFADYRSDGGDPASFMDPLVTVKGVKLDFSWTQEFESADLDIGI